MSVTGPLPDTPQTYVNATLDHLESALGFGRLLAEQVAALEAERDRLRAALRHYGLHTAECIYWRDVEYRAFEEDARCTCGFAEARR